MKIVITDYKETLDRDIRYEVCILKEMLPDAEVIVFEYRDNKEELCEVLADADAVKTAFVMMDKEILKNAEKLKCISFGSTGYNNADSAYANSRNIKIMAVPEYCTEEVADHTILLMLALNKNLKEYDKAVCEKKQWGYRIPLKSYSLQKQTLGLIGFGKIAKAVAVRAAAFGMKVLVCSGHLSEEEAGRYGVIKADRNRIMCDSDIISVHTDLNADNRHYLGKTFFPELKRRPIFINVSRGGLIDEKELINALDNGWIRAAGLDVLEEENPDLLKNPLCGRENVLLTPHAAFYSEEALRKLHDISTRNIGYFLNGEYEKINRIIS